LRDTARSRLSLAPESLAEELSSAAANYGSIVWTLTSGPWTGPVDDAGGQHGRTRGLRFELHSTVIPYNAGRRVARFAGPTVDRMAANQTRAEQQLIRDEHCWMRNE
jgi:hypothetical protein